MHKYIYIFKKLLFIKITQFVFKFKIKIIDSKLLGTKYGNWFIPSFLLDDKNFEGTCFTGGVGEDLSFEFLLSSITNHTFILYDFTPKAISYFNNIKSRQDGSIGTEDGILFCKNSRIDDFHLFPHGVSSKNGTIKFYPPKNTNHVSWSSVAMNEDRGLEFSVKSIVDITNSIPFENRSICKLDIEGSEADILANKICANSLFSFDIVLLELDYLKTCNIFQFYKYLFSLIKASSNYFVYYFDDYNIGFIKKDFLNNN